MQYSGNCFIRLPLIRALPAVPGGLLSGPVAQRPGKAADSSPCDSLPFIQLSISQILSCVIAGNQLTKKKMRTFFGIDFLLVHNST
jgi:hypothetical protein